MLHNILVIYVNGNHTNDAMNITTVYIHSIINLRRLSYKSIASISCYTFVQVTPSFFFLVIMKLLVVCIKFFNIG